MAVRNTTVTASTLGDIALILSEAQAVLPIIFVHQSKCQHNEKSNVFLLLWNSWCQ